MSTFQPAADSVRKRRKIFSGPSLLSGSEVTLGKLLSSSGSGSLYGGTCRTFPVLVRVPPHQELSEADMASAKEEVEILSQFYHPNLCLFLGASLDAGCVRIVTEHMTGSLRQHMAAHPQTPLPDRLGWALDAARGVTWLHSNKPPVIHGHLSTSTLLLSKAGKVKVSDFWGSQFRQEGARSKHALHRESLAFTAPELLQEEEITEKVDVYSFGSILYELVTGKEPFAGLTSLEEFVTAVCEEGRRPALPEDCPAELKDLVAGCWSGTAVARPSFQLIVNRLDSICKKSQRARYEARIDRLVEDEKGRELWKREFLEEREVKWRHFVSKLYDFLELSLPDDPHEVPLPLNPSEEELQHASHRQLEEFEKRSAHCADMVAMERRKRQSSGYRQIAAREVQPAVRTMWCAKAILDKNGKVTLERFGKFLGWFGPLLPDILQKVEEVLAQTWFHGDIGAAQAEKLLGPSSRRRGTFLVRFSSRTKNGFCISKLSEERTIKHLVIKHTPGVGFKTEKDVVYATLPLLIQAVSNSFFLLHACPESKYLWLFDDDESPPA
mmetsp:Transcript_14941/g.58539  ORF Transcript_14941/g.58539 Transcript_14941/m.58539 type:complete len:554 (+) Transcript_14941:172-1833(+)